MPQISKKKSLEIIKALEGMCFQFGYKTMKDNTPCLTTGGLSALEEAFSVLGWQDPCPVPEAKCFLCNKWATCGTPMPKNYTQNYARLCDEHYYRIQDEFERETK